MSISLTFHKLYPFIKKKPNSTNRNFHNIISVLGQTKNKKVPPLIKFIVKVPKISPPQT